MKPVAILRHDAHLGPGSLLDCLEQLAVPIQLFRLDKADLMPKKAKDFSGIVLLNSERSVLDPLQWIRTELSLCKDGLARGVPVLGLGYGAQMLTIAAGGKVQVNHSPSYGWTPSWLTPEASARFGVPATLEVFNAHAHTLELPPEAECFLLDGRCLNKGFTLGPHMGLLCSLELTLLSLVGWCAHRDTKLSQAQGPDVQSRVTMQRALPERIRNLRALAAQVFTHWAQQLPGAPRRGDTRLAA